MKDCHISFANCLDTSVTQVGANLWAFLPWWGVGTVLKTQSPRVTLDHIF